MATRLKRLELHGFKSFATPTTFVFDPGITAIIGPNGSGKSNIADAVRWALGEQSYSNLRGRRTEDVIFSGSAGRAPLGMAEVSITLDNEGGELPLPFNEITITRRAYRSGENQYLINGARVRLRDVLQVTASLGQAYTVIGQGLVDTVLSQRPSERRGLFEHAAGITGLRLKHAEAERHLAETRANITRLEDLLGEIEPRLRSLERAARQAREAGKVRQQLRDALLRLYAHHWRAARERYRAAATAAADAERTTTQAHQAVEAAAEAVLAAEARAIAAREALDALSGESTQLRAELNEVEHRIALTRERRDARERRASDLEREITELQTSQQTTAAESAETDAALEALTNEIAVHQAELAELEAADTAARQERAAREAELRRVERDLHDAERTALAAESRLDLLSQQAQDQQAALVQLEADQASRSDRLAELDGEAETARAALADVQERLSLLADARERLDAALATQAARREEVQRELRTLERQLVERSTRLETLARLRESGAGLYAGTRAVLEAARDGQLSGIVGALASLLVVPAELEAAMEAALGGHLQDIVVERWRDAERAIDYLKRSRTGRATFQPLDTVRGSRSHAPRLRAPGVLGVAADLIDYDERVAPIISGLLGRTVVTEDLTATRSILPDLPRGWSVVTLGGEITRSSGAVTGGARVKESGTLARERELRELPGECERLKQAIGTIQTRLDTMRRDAAALVAERDAVDADIAAAREAGRAAEAAIERVQRLRGDEERAASEAEQRRQAITERLTRIAAEREQAEAQGAAAQARQAELTTERDCLRQQLTEVDTQEPDTRLQDARAALARLSERQRGLRAHRQRLMQEAERLDRSLEAAKQRRAELAQELAQLADELTALDATRAQLTTELAEAEQRLTPAKQLLEETITAERAAREALTAAEARWREAERDRDRAALDLERRQDDLARLRERAMHDLGEDETQDLAEILEAVPEESTDEAMLQRQADRLRERLRRIGMVGDDAIEQYERESERYNYLRGQLDDVHAAGDALRKLLAELDQAMTEEFDQTFGEVAAAFEKTFTTLFGGGTAKLVRIQDDDGSGGVDILASPPGKRLQSLALLSGGERALTAVALLFAILRVNPSPFCVLDEVDAALDEANVVRVRDELQALAEETQFVVVTHNRATIEGADTLYGITMGDDGVSRVLSLRLPAEASA